MRIEHNKKSNACSGIAQSCLDLLQSARGRYDDA